MLVQLSGLLGLTQSETSKVTPDATGEGDFAEIFAKLDHSTPEPDQRSPSAETEEIEDASETDDAELAAEESSLDGSDASATEIKTDRDEERVLEAEDFSAKDQILELPEDPVFVEANKSENGDQPAGKLVVEPSDYDASSDPRTQPDLREIGGQTLVETSVAAAPKFVESIVLGKARLSSEMQPKPALNPIETIVQQAPSSGQAVPDPKVSSLAESPRANGRQVVLVQAERQEPSDPMTPVPIKGGETVSEVPKTNTELSVKTDMKVTDTHTVQAPLPPEVEQAQDILFASRKRPDVLADLAASAEQSTEKATSRPAENGDRIVSVTPREQEEFVAKSAEYGSKTALQPSLGLLNRGQAVADPTPVSKPAARENIDAAGITARSIEDAPKDTVFPVGSAPFGARSERADPISQPVNSFGSVAGNSLNQAVQNADAKSMPKPDGASVSFGETPKKAGVPASAHPETPVGQRSAAIQEGTLHNIGDVGETDGLDITVRSLASESKPTFEMVRDAQAAPSKPDDSFRFRHELHQASQRSDPVLVKSETGGLNATDNLGLQDKPFVESAPSQIQNIRASQDLPAKSDRADTLLETPKLESKQPVAPAFYEKAAQPASQPLGTQTGSVIYPFLFDADEVAEAPQELIQISSTGELRRSAETPVLSQSPTAPRANAAQVVQQLVDGAQKLSDGGVELRLSPEELGTVRMQFVHSEQGLTVNIQAERPETLELIKRNIEQLARDLAASGFDSAGFSFGDEGEPRQQQFGSGQEEPAVEDQQTAHPSMSVSQDGLDIRV